jgi:hypothetical protein
MSDKIPDGRFQPQYDDCVPVDFAALPREVQDAINAQVFEYEKERLRAQALHARLAARGLGVQANVLRVQDLYGDFPPGKTEKLGAIEAIVAQLEQGAVPALLKAIDDGAGTTAALRLLADVQSAHNAASFGERLAVALICKLDNDDAFRLPADIEEQTLEAIEIAAESLKHRLELVEEALQRLQAARTGIGGPLQ